MLVGKRALDGTLVKNLSPGSEKKVRLRCDQCGKETVTVWHNYIQYQRKRKWTGRTSCQGCAIRETSRASVGRPAPYVSEANRKRRGPKHPSWKGGRYIDNHGYVMISVRSGRSGKAGWSNYKKEHVVVMEKSIGRKLKKGEVIHHIDGDKLNNRPKNLFLAKAPGDHRGAHASLQAIGYQLIKAGLIRFDAKSVRYKAKKLLKEIIDAN